MEDESGRRHAVKLLLELQQNIELREELTAIAAIRLRTLDCLLKERLSEANAGHIHPLQTRPAIHNDAIHWQKSGFHPRKSAAKLDRCHGIFPKLCRQNKHGDPM